MRAKPFDASQFVATEWNSAADKAAFGNTYLHFIESDWKQSLFTKSFYPEEDLPAYMDVFDISEDRTTILPEEDESTHGLRLCLMLLVEHFLAPLGYLLNGEVSWDADDVNDRGSIFVKDNLIEDVEDVIVNAGPSWSPDHYSDPRLKQVIQDLVDSADNTGCSEDLTVVSAKYVEYLRETLPKL